MSDVPDRFLQELLAGMNLTRERHVTIRTGMICGTVISTAIVIGVVFVKIYAQKSLIDLFLILCAPGGVVATVLAIFLFRLRARMAAISQRLGNDSPPSKKTP